MIRELKCRDCKPPTRFPGCHGSCPYYQKWKKEHDAELEKERKTKWLKGLSRK